jgi:hypothetical protein
MTTTAKSSPNAGDTLLLFGAVKGAFIFRCDRSRRRFQIAGPYFKGQAIYSADYLPDERMPRTLIGYKSAQGVW